MAKFSERRRYVSRVIQPSTHLTLGEYDSRPPLARYVWYFTSYLRSSCCSETHVRPRLLPVFLPLSTLDVTHVRRCTRPSPLYRTASDEKLGVGLGTRLEEACMAGHETNKQRRVGCPRNDCGHSKRHSQGQLTFQGQ